MGGGEGGGDGTVVVIGHGFEQFNWLSHVGFGSLAVSYLTISAKTLFISAQLYAWQTCGSSCGASWLCATGQRTARPGEIAAAACRPPRRGGALPRYHCYEAPLWHPVLRPLISVRCVRRWNSLFLLINSRRLYQAWKARRRARHKQADVANEGAVGVVDIAPVGAAPEQDGQTDESTPIVIKTSALAPGAGATPLPGSSSKVRHSASRSAARPASAAKHMARSPLTSIAINEISLTHPEAVDPVVE